VARTCPSCSYYPIGPYTDNCPICGEPVRGVRGGTAEGRSWSSSMPLWMRLALGGAVAVVLAVGGCCCVGVWNVNRAARDFQQLAEQQRANEEAARRARTVTVTAADLLREFDEDPRAADRRYLGKWLEVSGVVERVGTDADDVPFALVHAGDAAAPLKIECLFDLADERDERQVKRLKPGQPVTVRGEYGGRVSNVQLRECELVE
jgi:hypothetical protein